MLEYGPKTEQAELVEKFVENLQTLKRERDKIDYITFVSLEIEILRKFTPEKINAHLRSIDAHLRSFYESSVGFLDVLVKCIYDETAAGLSEVRALIDPERNQTIKLDELTQAFKNLVNKFDEMRGSLEFVYGCTSALRGRFNADVLPHQLKNHSDFKEYACRLAYVSETYQLVYDEFSAGIEKINECLTNIETETDSLKAARSLIKTLREFVYNTQYFYNLTDRLIEDLNQSFSNKNSTFRINREDKYNNDIKYKRETVEDKVLTLQEMVTQWTEKLRNV